MAANQAHIAQDEHGAEVAWPFEPTFFPDMSLYRSGKPNFTMSAPLVAPEWRFAVGELAMRFPGIAPRDLTLATFAAYGARVSEDRAISFALRPTLDDSFKPATFGLPEGERFVDILARAVREAIPGRDAPRFAISSADADPLPLAVTLGGGLGEAVAAELHIHCSDEGDLVLRHAAHIAPDAAHRVAERMSALARAVALDPDALLVQQPIMSAAERALTVDTWNRTDAAYDYSGGLVAMMERRATETPDHPALIFMDDTLSFAEFNARVNRLARVLRGKGVGPDRFVALCMERSVELVIGLWATLKAGGAYVPLNTEDPLSRIQEIVGDCEPVTVLTQEAVASKLANLDADVTVLPEGGDVDPEGNGSDLSVERDFHDLAYMIYTSGSTGKPKGVVVEHGAIHNRVVWMHEEYGLEPSDRILQKTPYTFDVSVWEFLWSFAYGSTLVVAEPGGHMAMSYLYHTIRDHGVTHLHFVPSVLRMFLMIPSLADLPIKKLFCSGETLPHASVQRFYEKANHYAEVHNLYGPTEAAVDVSYFHCPRDPADPSIPIGRPVTNTGLYVLDENDQPCPVGVPGELHIGGVQLARGYFKRPDITAERFIANPLPDAAHPRLYKTGDLAFHRPDGEIVYLGRNDFQVKINGVRMELGEIEAAIHDAGGVKDVVVVAEEQGGNKVLIAYAVAADPGEATAERLKQAVGATRPVYYVPREVRFLLDMPLTVSGKIDRKKLGGWPRAA